MSRDDAVKAGAVLLLLVILAGLQKFGLLAGFMEWLKAATVAAICSVLSMSETTARLRNSQCGVQGGQSLRHRAHRSPPLWRRLPSKSETTCRDLFSVGPSENC